MKDIKHAIAITNANLSSINQLFDNSVFTSNECRELFLGSGTCGVNGIQVDGIWLDEVVGVDYANGPDHTARVQVIRCEHCGQKNYVNFDKLPSIAVIACQSCGGDLL